MHFAMYNTSISLSRNTNFLSSFSKSIISMLFTILCMSEIDFKNGFFFYEYYEANFEELKLNTDDD